MSGRVISATWKMILIWFCFPPPQLVSRLRVSWPSFGTSAPFPTTNSWPRLLPGDSPRKFAYPGASLRSKMWSHAPESYVTSMILSIHSSTGSTASSVSFLLSIMAIVLSTISSKVPRIFKTSMSSLSTLRVT